MGSTQVQKVLKLVRSSQGVPLSVIEKTKELAGVQLTDEELNLLVRLAHDGAVKPPSLTTSHAGEQFLVPRRL